MKNQLFLVLFFTLFLYRVDAQSYVPLFNETRMAVEPKIPIKAYPLPLQQVKLLDSPFKTAMEADKTWLLSLQPDRFLHRFHENAGFTPKASIYEGWENSTQSGFCFGHYLSAMSMLYAADGDDRVKTNLEYSINELRRCQDARGTGYVDAIPDGDKLWNDVVNGKIDANTGWLNGIWVPWYNLHKLWAGLIDAYLYTGNETAKNIVVDLTDWACDKFKNLTDAQWQAMLHCETGGINDALYNTYAITGDPRHLALAEKFYHKAVLDPLSEHKDELSGLHANTQVPKITGAARAYELIANEKDKTIANYFWETVVHDHTYCIGGNSNYEHFDEPGKLSLSNKTTETCNTYNMLKLTRHLFAWEPKAEYVDYYERALYNHILASQNPNTGMVVYYLPLAYNSFKDYSSPDQSFWCCVGTGFENHVKYAEGIYSENENELYINLFVASELDWKRQNMTITQQTDFPDSDKTRLTVKTPSSKDLTFHIRYPEWVEEGFSIKINGQVQTISNKPGSYVSITRLWADNDVVEIEIPKTLHKELLLGDEHKSAFLNGPIVLAGETDPQEKTIVFLEQDEDMNNWIKPTNPGKTTFHTESGYPANLDFIPFYKKHEGYYSIYFDCYHPDEWEAVKEEYEREEELQREIERLTLDYFRPNEQQQEIDHNFKGTRVGRGDGTLGKKWCDTDGGYFSFEMAVDPALPANLVLTYWGSDGGNRKFDILVEDEVIAVEELTAHKPDEYFDRTYPVPFHLIKDKTKVTVKLRAYSGNKAGGIFFARMMLKKEVSENSITITDFLLPCEPYLANHNYFCTRGSKGTHKGYPWVDANENREMSFLLKSSADKPMWLLLSYWGGETSKRNFSILVEDTEIATQELYKNKPDEFFDALYEIPESLTKGKDQLKITLKGKDNSKAGGLFYAYAFSKGGDTFIESVESDEDFPFHIKVSNSIINLFSKNAVTLCGAIFLFSPKGDVVYRGWIDEKAEFTINQKLSKGVYLLHYNQTARSIVYSTKIVVS